MPTKRELIAGLLLGIAGFAGNWFKYPLFLNIDFLFGSFFVMTALLRFGLSAGVLASLIASSCTWLLWKHPYAMVIFTVEVVAVGILNNRRKKSDILLHDILYWLCLGAPLVWLFYHHLLHDTYASTVLIMLKQMMNGIFNALLASIACLIMMTREKTSESRPSFRQVVATIMVSLVLIPAFLFIFYDLKNHSSQRSELLARQTLRAAETGAALVAGMLNHNQQILAFLGKSIGDPSGRGAAEIQTLLETVKGVSPEFWRMGVFDSAATTVAYSPRIDDLGRSTIGISLADRPYLKELKESGKPHIAGVLPGRLTTAPVVPLLSPIMVAGEFRGFCSGLLNTGTILEKLKTIIGNLDMQITVLDQAGKVVVSSRGDFAPMTPYPRPAGQISRQITAEVVQLIPPPEKGRNLMQRWGKSRYAAEMEISPDSRWKVVVENSYAPLLDTLRSNASTSLAGLVFLSLLTVPLSHLLSRQLTRSLEKLRNSTQSLPEDIRNRIPESLPASSIQEISELVDNFRMMRGALQDQHDSLIELNQALKQKNAYLAESEERFRILAEVAPYAVLVNRDNAIEYANPAAIKLFDAATAGDLLGKEPLCLFHPDYHAIITERIREVLQGRSLPMIEETVVTLDGATKIVESAAVAFIDSKGVAIYVLLHDITDRKRSEDSLRTVLRRLSQAQLSAGAGLWDWDVASGKLTWSAELFTLFGLGPEQNDAGFELWRQVMHPDDWTRAERQVRTALARKERLVNEYRIIRNGGEIRWISAIGDTVYDDSGAPLRMSGICIDITERKLAEERLNLLAQISERLLSTDSPRSVLEELCSKALPVLGCQAFFNFMADSGSGRLKLGACCGISEEEKQQIQWLDYGEAVCGCVARDACRIVAEEIPQTADERTAVVKSFGIQAYACHPIMLGEEVLGTLSFGSRSKSRFNEDELAVMKAVTDLVAIALERERAEESVQRAKIEWELTFDSVPDLIAIIDENHRITRVNLPMARKLGLEPAECIGRHCHEVIHGDDAPPGFCPHTRSICDNKTCETEIYEETLGGDFLVSTTPLYHDGRLIGTVHVARDISDRKRAEMALREANEMLDEKVRDRTAQLADTIGMLQEEVNERQKAQESLRIEMLEKVRVTESLRDQEKLMILQSRQAAMGEMIGNIAHQWRQPLNILGLLLQQMDLFHETGRFDAEFLRQSVGKGMEIIRHMSRTIDDFRNFFRPEKEPHQFGLQETINNTITLVNDSFVSQTIGIEVQNDLELKVHGYQNEFSQALLNILINAKDALLERKIDKPRISISVDRKNGTAVIVIKDNAGGMPEEIIDKIFDPYFTTKGPQQGTGLGLYMAKMIIEKNMGGKLWARNGDVGAEFYIQVGQIQA